ncbi:oxidoreductase protein (plasmid) [Rhizobium phaseoli]|uniref:Gfo/Idh/MocA family protein n=1 Tax=Rhizobium phaseoli TaxID=396 RepID=UPI0002DA1E0B|nr:Gfo/Idh/MocA family oxidoreductase [Rhizobium phaseoli]ANL75765.1 oxidoreductase protein [Rhizobium phaseoli]KKZ83633.1 putative oxidoreductase [Rhizobium phaseoli Ch24-10]RDJ03404.1 oxidoreductase [Rhizobium phaseoli]RDJ05143.1 oxidoreductase [Rhizobium phaseoli]
MDERVSAQTATALNRVKLGFLGVGWIGRHRMKAVLDSGLAEAIAIADPSAEMVRQARTLAPDTVVATDLEELLDQQLDGIVIATPSASHAEHAVRALEAGIAVFCQKPLGRTASEVKAVVDASKAANKLLGVDFSYRHTEGMRQIRELIRSGALGKVFAADLTFHNAYGPDKPWFYDKTLSGGGCLIDLGVHLIDLALWCLDFPSVTTVTSELRAGGKRLEESGSVEDFAAATLTLSGGQVLRLTSSWRLQAGCDAVIGADFFGTDGGASFRNVDGSFYDFTAARLSGTSREILVEPPEEWGGRAAVDWTSRLARGQRYDPAAEEFVAVASVIDDIYQAGGCVLMTP